MATQANPQEVHMWRQPPPAVSLVAPTEKAQRERRRALIIPREHGAWGLLLVPMVTGAGVAFRESTNIIPFVLLLTAALALFWLRTPVESLLGTTPMRVQNDSERRTASIAVIFLAVVATAALTALLWAGRNWYLGLIGSAAAVAFVTQALLKQVSRSARFFAELIGTAGLTSAGPAAYYVITGKFDATAWTLWFANFLFAANQIHYVQTRIHNARIDSPRARLAHAWPFAVGQLFAAALLILACRRSLLPWAALVAFAPILFRGFLYFFQKPAPLQVRRLGWSELAQAILFCTLLITIFAMAGKTH